MRTIMISIIIPTKDEQKLLPRLLDSICAQTFKDFEIIVADANSRDDTVKIAQSYGCKVVKGGMPGVGRNRGAAVAQGDFLVFFDADVIIPDDFLEKAFSEFQERYLEVATCSYLPDSEEYRSWFDLYNAYAKAVQHVRPCSGGAFMIMTRRIFDRIGGFDESLKLAEDHNLVKRASSISKFRILDGVSLTLSVRRFDKEGIIRFITRAIRSEFYRSFIGEIRDDIFDYEMGNYDEEREKEKKRIRELAEKIKNKFEKEKKRKRKKRARKSI